MIFTPKNNLVLVICKNDKKDNSLHIIFYLRDLKKDIKVLLKYINQILVQFSHFYLVVWKKDKRNI